MATTARSFASASSAIIDLRNPTSLQITGALTISCWVNFTSLAANTGLVTKHTGTNKLYGLYWATGLGLVFTTSPDGTSEPFAATLFSFTNGVWYHLAGVYVPSTSLTIYIDGVQQAQQTTGVGASIANATPIVTIGGRSSLQWFLDGAMKAVAIYAEALTQPQIAAIRTGGPLAHSMTNLRAWLELDGYLSPEPDSSNNGNFGTLTATGQTTGPTAYTPANYPYSLGRGAVGTAATGNIALGVPPTPVGGHLNNDLWIAVVHSADNVAHSFTDWTQIFQANGGSTASRLSIWYFRYAGSTPNLVVTHTGGQTPVGGIVSFRNILATGSPVHVLGTGSAGTVAAISFSGITTTQDKALVLAIDGSADDNPRVVSTLPSIPAGYSPCFDAAGPTYAYVGALGTPDGSISMNMQVKWTAGATGALTDTQSAADPWASVVVALQMSAAGPTSVSLILPAGMGSARRIGQLY